MIHTDKSKEMYVMAGLIDKKGPAYRSHLVAVDGYLYATDGAAVIRIRYDIEPGFYQVTKRNKSQVEFVKALDISAESHPDFESVLKPDGAYPDLDIPDPIRSADALYYYIISLTDTPYAFRLIGCAYELYGESTRVYKLGDRRPLVFDSPDVKMAIMEMELAK